jgi:hypothetical protein
LPGADRMHSDLGERQTVALFSETPLEELRDSDLLQEKTSALLKRYFLKNMGRRPMMVPVIWEM